MIVAAVKLLTLNAAARNCAQAGTGSDNVALALLIQGRSSWRL